MLKTCCSEDIELKFDRLCLNRIGFGGFAQVFHIFYKEKDAVLKQLKEPDDDKALAKMLNECELMFLLGPHANICQCYGILHKDPIFSSGIVMEYCAGGDLQNLMEKLKIEEILVETMTVLGWCRQISATMQYVSQKIVHADLKPMNILIKEHVCTCHSTTYKSHTFSEKTYQLCSKCHGVSRDQITLKIADFGLAFPRGKTDANACGGTLTYRAPETLSGKYSEKSDVYAFGYIMFYLVLGEPYRMKEEGQIAFLKFSKVALDISDVSSKSIAKLIQECTLDDPEMRPNFSQLTIELRKKFANYEKLASNSKQRKRFEKERNECKRIYQNLLPSVSLETIQTSIEISDEEENLNQNSSKHSSFSQNSQENRYENNNFEEDDEENRDYQEILDTNSNPRLEKKRFRQLTTTLASKFQRLFRQ